MPAPAYYTLSPVGLAAPTDLACIDVDAVDAQHLAEAALARFEPRSCGIQDQLQPARAVVTIVQQFGHMRCAPPTLDPSMKDMSISSKPRPEQHHDAAAATVRQRTAR